MSERLHETAEPTDAERQYREERLDAYHEAVRNGEAEHLSFQEWDHRQRSKERAAWHVDVATGNFGPDGVSGEDVAYHERLREMHDETSGPDDTEVTVHIDNGEAAVTVDGDEVAPAADTETTTTREVAKELEFLASIPKEHWQEMREEAESRIQKAVDSMGISRVGNVREMEKQWVEQTTRVAREKAVRDYLEKAHAGKEISEDDVNEMIQTLGHGEAMFNLIINALSGTKAEGPADAKTEPKPTDPADATTEPKAGKDDLPAGKEVEVDPDKPVLPIELDELEEGEPGSDVVPSPLDTSPRGRLRSIFISIKNSPASVYVWINNTLSGLGSGGGAEPSAGTSGEPPAGTRRVITEEETVVASVPVAERERRRRIWPVALAAGAAG